MILVSLLDISDADTENEVKDQLMSGFPLGTYIIDSKYDVVGDPAVCIVLSNNNVTYSACDMADYLICRRTIASMSLPSVPVSLSFLRRKHHH